MPRTPAQAPSVAREQRRIDVARTLGHALLDANVTHVAAAEAIGMAPQHLAECAKPGGTKHLALADVGALDKDVALAVLRYPAAAHNCEIVELPEGDAASSSDLVLAATTQRETSEVISALLVGVADGHLDAREGKTLERECDEAIRALLAVRQLARRAQRERVIGTTGGVLRAVGK